MHCLGFEKPRPTSVFIISRFRVGRPRFPPGTESCWLEFPAWLWNGFLFSFFFKIWLSSYSCMFLHGWCRQLSRTSWMETQSRPAFMGEERCRLIDTNHCYGFSADTKRKKKKRKTANYCEQLFIIPSPGLWMLLERRNPLDPMWPTPTGQHFLWPGKCFIWNVC